MRAIATARRCLRPVFAGELGAMLAVLDTTPIGPVVSYSIDAALIGDVQAAGRRFILRRFINWGCCDEVHRPATAVCRSSVRHNDLLVALSPGSVGRHHTAFRYSSATA
jgi:hypothetical protein